MRLSILPVYRGVFCSRGRVLGGGGVAWFDWSIGGKFVWGWAEVAADEGCGWGADGEGGEDEEIEEEEDAGEAWAADMHCGRWWVRKWVGRVGSWARSRERESEGLWCACACVCLCACYPSTEIL